MPLSLACLSLSIAIQAQDALAAARAQARRLTEQLAADCFLEAAKISLDVYVELGPLQRDIDRVRSAVEHIAKPPRTEKVKDALREATRAAEACMKAAAQASADEGERLSRIALVFDSQCKAANERLNHPRVAEGRWVTQEQAALLQRRDEIARAIAQARALDVDVVVKAPSDPALLEILGASATAVEHDGLVFESYLPIDTLVSTVKGIVRAMAFSNWLLHGEMKPRHEGGKMLHLPPERYDEFLKRIVDSGRADPRSTKPDGRSAFEYVTMPSKGGDVYHSYAVTSAALRSSLGPMSLALYDRSLLGWDWSTWYEADPGVPFWLTVGHIGLVSLSFLGASPPDFDVSVDGPQGTSSKSVVQMLSMGEAGLMGCRSYLRDLAKTGEDPPLASCILNQFSKIVGEKRLKAISIVERLHECSSLGRFLESYAKLRGKEASGEEQKRSPVVRAEKALGQSLPEVDAQWRAWVLTNGDPSVRDSLESLTEAQPVDTAAAQVLKLLNDRRASAHLDPVALDPELSAGAARHAEYLTRHPEQANRWPDAHEESLEAADFTPAGSWAGTHSVIAQNSPAKCVDEWLATFYHRLPLLHPGLLRIGFGSSGNVCVLDASSVVSPGGVWEVAWPCEGLKDVPRAFPGELPAPVPGREGANVLGYPITFQLGPRVDSKGFTIVLSDGAGRVMPCVLSTPGAPSNPQLSPDQAWCLLPEAPLAPNRDYRVRVEFGGTVREWGFQTGK